VLFLLRGAHDDAARTGNHESTLDAGRRADHSFGKAGSTTRNHCAARWNIGNHRWYRILLCRFHAGDVKLTVDVKVLAQFSSEPNRVSVASGDQFKESRKALVQFASAQRGHALRAVHFCVNHSRRPEHLKMMRPGRLRTGD
jgi:hypothetical protein